MACTLYLDKIRISTNEWYEGLEVTIECDVGDFDAPSAGTQALVRTGLSSGSDCDCGRYPANVRWFGTYQTTDVPSGGMKTYTFKHTVTRSDLDLIKSGVRRCFGWMSQGLSQHTCYERSSVTVKEEIICTEGDERSPETCWDGSVIHKEICRDNTWVNSGENCPVDPCEDVTCEPDCYGVDKYQTVCEEGICIKGTLIKMDDPECGYVPPDLCEGVTCDPKCYGKDKYETYCVNGLCIQGSLIQKDHPDCLYAPPDVNDYLIYIIIGAVIIAAYLLWRNK